MLSLTEVVGFSLSTENLNVQVIVRLRKDCESRAFLSCTSTSLINSTSP